MCFLSEDDDCPERRKDWEAQKRASVLASQIAHRSKVVSEPEIQLQQRETDQSSKESDETI